MDSISKADFYFHNLSEMDEVWSHWNILTCPCRAIQSTFGDDVVGCPVYPRSPWPRSSTRNRIIFGWDCPKDSENTDSRKARNNKNMDVPSRVFLFSNNLSFSYLIWLSLSTELQIMIFSKETLKTKIVWCLPFYCCFKIIFVINFSSSSSSSSYL